MSTTAILASSAAVSSSIAAQQAREREEQCKLYVEGFDNLKSSTAEKQHYAECIETLYPEEMNNAEILGTKICIVALFIGLIVGCVKGYKDGDDWTDVPLCGLLGVAAVAFGILALGLIVMGVSFLIS